MRFAQEAQITGQLQHPSIIPVYDLGEREDGQLYFTMKRVEGRTLRDIFKGLRADDPTIVSEYAELNYCRFSEDLYGGRLRTQSFSGASGS